MYQAATISPKRLSFNLIKLPVELTHPCWRIKSIILFVITAVLIFSSAYANASRYRFDNGWKFHPGELSGTDGYTSGIPVTSWRYLIDNNGLADAATYTPAGFNDSSWATAQPGQNIFGSTATYAWYRLNLQNLIGSNQDIGPRYVTFNTIDDNAWVYLNGNLITQHIGWNEAFAVSLDAYWRNGGPNELAVLVQNTGGPGNIGVASVSLGSTPPLSVGLISYDDSSWQSIHLPHDYVVQGTFSSNADQGHGCLPTQPAWYRKRFNIPSSYTGKDIWLDFDGAYRNASVFVNGHSLGIHPSGYIGFHCDISQLLNYGADNEIAVHVDPTFFEGWWYEGGGINRHVWLNVTDPLHLAPNCAYVKSTISSGASTENITTSVVNTSLADQTGVLQSIVTDINGTLVFSLQSDITVPANSIVAVDQSGVINNPILWTLVNPYLYRLHTKLLQGSVVLDAANTDFGVRTIQYTGGGFFLNGQHILLQGMCNHADFIGVGIGMPDSVLYYRLLQLKAMGCNAYRTSHGPVSAELLDYCDRLGILVMDENRHLGDSYYSKASVGDPYSNLQDLKEMIIRDRNHPSVIMWSLCNEEWGTQGNTYGQAAFQAMKDMVKALDNTRPVTGAQNGAYQTPGFCPVMDIIGINYNYWVYQYIQSYFPNIPIYASETGSALSTRGVYQDDTVNCWESAYDVDAPSWGWQDEPAWQAILNYPFMAGGFFWTGFDYLGEPTPYPWPAVSSQFGALDRCGFPKDDFYYFQSVWTTTPMVHILPHWNWSSGQTIDVWTYSNCNQVELFLNGVSQGKKANVTAGHVSWQIPWVAGTLKAIGYDASGNQITTDTVTTASAPATIKLNASKSIIAPDGEDLSVIQVTVTDAQGSVVPTANNLVSFSITGPGHLAGVGNGNPSSHELEQDSKRLAFNGKCAVLVQSNEGQTGTITLTASSNGLTSISTTIQVSSTAPESAVSLSGPAGSNGWFTGDVKAAITSLESNPSFTPQFTYYAIDQTPIQLYSIPVSISGNGSHMITYYSVDQAGNQEASKIGSVNIDSTAPVTTASQVTNNNISTTVTLIAADNLSGIAATYYTLDGGAAQTYNSSFTVSSTVNHTVNYWSVDKAGNIETAKSLTLMAVKPPTITSLSPSTVSGAKTFTLTVNGTNFVSGSVIKWNGTNMTTTYVSPTQLTASINKYYTTLTSYPGSATISILNPDGTRSSGATLTITAPLPAISSLSPSSVTGATTFTLTVNGSNFVSGSIIKWNGTNMTTTYVSATQLTASINKYYDTLSSYPGSATVSVLNPDGGRSTGSVITITQPITPPAITSLSPSSIKGATTFTLTVNGTGFQSGAVIKWNGTNMTTTYVSATQLTAVINKYYDTLASYPGSATVSVLNPDSGRSTGTALAITQP